MYRLSKSKRKMKEQKSLTKKKSFLYETPILSSTRQNLSYRPTGSNRSVSHADRVEYNSRSHCYFFLGKRKKKKYRKKKHRSQSNHISHRLRLIPDDGRPVGRRYRTVRGTDGRPKDIDKRGLRSHCRRNIRA